MALPIFASALGINLDQMGISVVGVSGGGGFKSFIKLLHKSALDIPYIVLCDGDEVATNTARAMKEIGIINFDVSKKDIEINRQHLEKNRLYILPNGDFETYLLSEDYTKEYELAISRVFGQGKLDSYVKSRIKSDRNYVNKSKKENIEDFIDNMKKKPALAFEVANEITNNGTDPTNIPEYFKKVLIDINEVAKREIGYGIEVS